MTRCFTTTERMSSSSDEMPGLSVFCKDQTAMRARNRRWIGFAATISAMPKQKQENIDYEEKSENRSSSNELSTRQCGGLEGTHRCEEMRRWYFDMKEFKPEVGFELESDLEHEDVNIIIDARSQT